MSVVLVVGPTKIGEVDPKYLAPFFDPAVLNIV